MRIDGAPLAGMRVCNLAVNLPGPLAAARLQALGASVRKVEPPGGDPLTSCPPWYASLTAGQQIVRLDLKQPDGRAALAARLSDTDLLITAMRPDALSRLDLDWPTLHARYPNLCQVAILGYATPEPHPPGHDLTFQAEAGLLDPPHLPRALVADCASAEQAVCAALALLLAQARGQGAGYATVSLADAAVDFAAPLHYGLTVPGGLLGGALPGYGLYRAQDGWIAVAALEPHFATHLAGALDLPELTHEALTAIFRTRRAADWAAWAAAHNLPLVAVVAGRKSTDGG